MSAHLMSVDVFDADPVECSS
eukprot:SAG31_NODE_46506_length_254_cov_0.670968_1_plen_20_part_01